jgi:hypothetical protein
VQTAPEDEMSFQQRACITKNLQHFVFGHTFIISSKSKVQSSKLSKPEVFIWPRAWSSAFRRSEPRKRGTPNEKIMSRPGVRGSPCFYLLPALNFELQTLNSRRAQMVQIHNRDFAAARLCRRSGSALASVAAQRRCFDHLDWPAGGRGVLDNDLLFITETDVDLRRGPRIHACAVGVVVRRVRQKIQGFVQALTGHILKTEQTDITQQGYLFSAVIIFLGNVAILLLAVPLLTAKVGVLTSFGWWLQCTGDFLQRLGRLF